MNEICLVIIFFGIFYISRQDMEFNELKVLLKNIKKKIWKKKRKRKISFVIDKFWCR